MTKPISLQTVQANIAIAAGLLGEDSLPVDVDVVETIVQNLSDFVPSIITEEECSPLEVMVALLSVVDTTAISVLGATVCMESNPSSMEEVEEIVNGVAAEYVEQKNAHYIEEEVVPDLDEVQNELLKLFKGLQGHA